MPLSCANRVFGAFSRPEGLLASASSDRTVRVWDPERGVSVRVLEGRENRLRGVAFNLKGDLLAAAGVEGLLKIWDVSETIRLV
jgi:WD40 repeat protein